MRWVDADVATREATAAALERHIATGAWLAVVEDGDVVGEVGFEALGDEVEMGWTFRRDTWGRGLATEACRAALAIAPAPRVIAVIRPANAASIRVAEKLGFVAEGPREVRGRLQLVYRSGIAGPATGAAGAA